MSCCCWWWIAALPAMRRPSPPRRPPPTPLSLCRHPTTRRVISRCAAATIQLQSHTFVLLSVVAVLAITGSSPVTRSSHPFFAGLNRHGTAPLRGVVWLRSGRASGRNRSPRHIFLVHTLETTKPLEQPR